MLIHVHGTCVPAVRITAGGIVPDSSRARCKPDLKRIEEDPVGIIRIYGDSLVVPVLRIIALTASTVSKRAALRTVHESPACATVCASPGADLATSGVAAATIIVTDDGLGLGIDVIRVARRDSNIYSTQLIAGGDINKRRASAGIHVRTSRIRAAGHCITEHKAIGIAGD